MIWFQLIGWLVVVALFGLWFSRWLRARRLARWRAWVQTMPAPVEAHDIVLNHRGFADISYPTRPGVTHYQLPAECPHNFEPETCRFCAQERAVLDAGGELPESDRPRPLPLPLDEALEILRQLPAPDPMVPESERPAVPAWSLEHTTEEVAFWGMIHTLDQYGLIQIVDGAELRVRLTEAGEWSRGPMLPEILRSEEGAPE